MKYILQCPKCGQVYKTDLHPTVKGARYITDYNDDVTEKCIKCNSKMTPSIMKTEDWIADLVFKIKGER